MSENPNMITRGEGFIGRLITNSIKLGGTLITATAAEINKLAGVVAGTVTASKALIVDANKRLDTLVIGTLALGAGAGTAVTSTAEELNKLDGVTLTTEQINLLLQAVAGGKKIAYGVRAVGAASEDVVTGLAIVEAATCSLVGDPSMTHDRSTVTVGDQAGAPAAGSIRIKSWKPTAANDCTPIAAADVFANVAWIAIGI